MKLSEAIRLGATMKPQAFGKYFDGTGTCAIGAAWDALGLNSHKGIWDVGRTAWPENIAKTINDLNPVPCPLCERIPAAHVIPHLNDTHCWTRERIADFVELHEALPTPEISPEIMEPQRGDMSLSTTHQEKVNS